MDTISLILNKEQVPNIDLMAETPIFLTSITSDGISYGKPTINGKFNGFNVSINEDRIKIRDASLTKYLLGNNLSMMGRSAIEQAINKMSDELHLPMHSAKVVKFHYAKNILLNNEVGLYLNYLGNYPRHSRLEQPYGLNYKQASKEFALYDKIRESKLHREYIHPLYNNRYMMRLESRYGNNLPKYFNKPSITASLLYDEDFYMQVNNDWYNDYLKIDKVKNYKIDMKEIKKVEDLKLLGVLALVQMDGGLLQSIKNLKERHQKKEITKKQHHDLKVLIEKSANMKIQAVESELIQELNQKVKESMKYYR